MEAISATEDFALPAQLLTAKVRPLGMSPHATGWSQTGYGRQDFTARRPVKLNYGVAARTGVGGSSINGLVLSVSGILKTLNVTFPPFPITPPES